MGTESTQVIRIEVRDKVALNRTPEIFLVGGNSDYKVVFDFDGAWEGETLRTAIFVYGGYKPVLVPFTGNECDIPVISGSTVCQVGVTAGNMRTTTPAYVNCKLSIRDVGGEIEPPTEDVYNKIVSMIESGILKGEQGEKGEKGEKGDAGSIKFIPVVQLPDKADPTIDQSAIYVEPLANPDEKNKYGEYIFVNGDWEKLGEITIEVDHREYVKFTDRATSDGKKAGIVQLKAYGSGGLDIDNSGNLVIRAPSKTIIDQKSQDRPITPPNMDYAWKVAATTNTETWTDDDKAKACETIGAVAKQTKALILYGTDANGNQTAWTLRNTNNTKNTIAGRDSNGNIQVGTAVNATDATNKKYVDDGFVAQSQPTSGIRLYGSNNVKQTTFDLNKNGIVMLSSNNLTIKEMASGEAKAWTIAERSTDGALYVGPCTLPKHATPMEYVDGKIAELLARIEALEGK